MQPAALPTVSPRARTGEMDLELGLAQTGRNDAPSPQRADAQIDGRLQDLQQRPARTAPRRAQPALTRQRIASCVADVAGVTAALTGIASVAPPLVGFFAYIGENDQMAKFGGIATLAGVATTGTLSAIQRLASLYAYGNNITDRASALGISAENLRRAVDLVTIPEENERHAHPMSEAESNALAIDLMHLSTTPFFRLDTDLWNAARRAGDSADALIEALLALRRQPAPESHAAAASSSA
ncbi:type III secretion system effector XopAV [Xanthomonas graminis]|uniref:Uncharacterized protein n=2 Tax=Xanthomonas translucens group TaxID=3390202 RepID=A0A0K3AB28_9XANT|nr:type III secretion system effector XopAV [Xanthomonas translucens]CTP92700.1 hypothetical protein XTALMG727_3856 [Xanthomonas translucens pv. arrhenatheri LMG 727]